MNTNDRNRNRKMRGRGFVFAALLVLSASSTRSAAAQAPAAKGPGGVPPGTRSSLETDDVDSVPPDRRARRQKLYGEIMQRMRTMRVWKLTEELRLDDGQVAKVLPLLARFDEQEQALADQRSETMRAVKFELSAPKPDDKKLRASVDTLLDNKNKRAAMDSERLKALCKLLSPVQQARLVVLWPRMDEGFRRHLRDAVEKHARRAGRKFHRRR